MTLITHTTPLLLFADAAAVAMTPLLALLPPYLPRRVSLLLLAMLSSLSMPPPFRHAAFRRFDAFDAAIDAAFRFHFIEPSMLMPAAFRCCRRHAAAPPLFRHARHAAACRRRRLATLRHYDADAYFLFTLLPLTLACR